MWFIHLRHVTIERADVKELTSKEHPTSDVVCPVV